MELVITLFSLIVISYLFTFLLKKIKIPKVVSLILLGVIFGSTSFGNFYIGESTDAIEFIGTLGIFSLLFLAGLESSFKTLIKEEGDALWIALFSSGFALVFGFISFLFLGFSLLESFVVSLCLSITAEGTKARVLMEFNKIKSRVSAAMLGAGIVDDLFGLLLFSIFMLSIGVVDFAEHLLLLGLLVSFGFGLLAQHFAKEHHLTHKLEVFFTYFIIPFFFINMGAHFDVTTLFTSPRLFFIIFTIAILGKLMGTFLAKKFTNFTYQQLHLIGWGMNSRGAIEIALALIAFNAGIISNAIFSALVLTALITTLFFPFVLEIMLKKNPKIMD